MTRAHENSKNDAQGVVTPRAASRAVSPGAASRAISHGGPARPEHRGASDGLSLPSAEALLEHAPREFLRRMPDRETFAWPDARPDGPPSTDRVIVKRAFGSPAREAWYERLHGMPARAPAMREYANLVALAADGVCVPRALLSWEEPRRAVRRARRSVVVMECVAHRETLRERAGRSHAAERRVWADLLLELVLALHCRGWYHRDLYLQHVLVREIDGARIPARGSELVLIDVGRARKERAPRARWFVKDLAALLHSTPANVSARERMRFLARYLDRREIHARAERRGWLRDIVGKAQRMAAHVPRFGEAESSQ